MINWQECINNYVEAQKKPFIKPEAGVFRASELSGCVRQCTLNRLGLKKYSVDVLRNFEIGTNLHRFIQEKVGVGFVGRPVEFEKTVLLEYDSVKFTGHVDCFDGERVYDFKSIKGFTFVTPGNISKGYIYQLHVYMFALGVDSATLVYIDKNTWEVKQLDVNFTMNTMDEIVEFCKAVDAAVEEFNFSGKLPASCGCFACKCESEKVS